MAPAETKIDKVGKDGSASGSQSMKSSRKKKKQNNGCVRRCLSLFKISWSLNKWFENTIYFFIMLSMIILVIDRPYVRNASFTSFIEKVDTIISVIFTIEAVCRITALGFFTSSLPQKKGYIRSGTNQIDFLVCVACDAILIYKKQLNHYGLKDKTI